MATIVIDPIIVMLPSNDEDAAQIQAWLEQLLLWLTEALTAPFTWLHCYDAIAHLEALGRFPSFALLRQLQQRYQLDINISHIANQIRAFFLDEANDLYTHILSQAYDIEYTPDSTTIEPPQFMHRLPDAIRNTFLPLLTQCCACKQLNLPPGNDLHIATLKLTDDAKEIQVSFTLIASLPEIHCQATGVLSHTFPLVITPHDLLPLIDIVAIWEQGEHAILYAITQHCKNRWPALTPCAFRLGPAFLQSVQERNLATNVVLLHSFLHAAADTIVNQAKYSKGYRLHSFREKEAADSPQSVRARDQARGWRLMLQKHGAGWRLQYWEIATNQGRMVEFANVCRESERDIL